MRVWQIASLEQCEMRLRSEVRDTLDQNELLEFRILELEVRESVLLTQHQADAVKLVSCLHHLHT